MKRLEKEFALIRDNMKEQYYHWELLIDGPQGSPYEGFKFVLDVDFP